MSDEEPSTSTPPVSQQPRAYVGLLTEVMSNTLDEDYATVAAKRPSGPVESPRGRRTRNNRIALTSVVVAFGLMLGISALKTDKDRPVTRAERDELVAQIHNRQHEQAQLAAQLNAVQDDVTDLQNRVGTEASRNSQITDQLVALGVQAGTLAVEGPGMVITVDDAPSADEGSGGTILDTDLQALVNGLWAAGAEAVSIDGHRLTSLTAIRFAGSAITVDNVSLAPPYVITAIGNPDTLPARLLETEGGQTWLGLEANFGIRFDRETKENVVVPGDPHDHLLYAEPDTGG
ncbi:MAG TPA: DUF881 domain-containing protein [Nocardioidaceae bacterium]|jgi:uncharacterized protein YlxW (UPF0749 family)